VILAALGVLAASSIYTVDETEQVIITQFGEPLGDAITEPGIKIKVPFIHRVNRFDKRWIAWDGDPNEVPTKDKKYIHVDCYARWRISDPLKYFEVVQGAQVVAQSRLDDVIDGETRNVIASYHLIEVVRESNRDFEVSEEVKDLVQTEESVEIEVGRARLAAEILERAATITPSFGIELVDVRFKRVNYIASVRQKAYERMISERQRIAEQSRSEGLGRSAEIRGQMERELKKITSEAYRQSEEIRGKADAEATRVYAEAYNQDPDFYGFLRTLETWETGFAADTRLLLTTDTEFLRYLNSSSAR